MQFKLKEYEDALALLEPATREPCDPAAAPHSSSKGIKDGEDIDISAAICTLAGEIHEHLENHPKAKFYFIQALSIDGRCFDAFEKLVNKFMLTENEEVKLDGDSLNGSLSLFWNF